MKRKLIKNTNGMYSVDSNGIVYSENYRGHGSRKPLKTWLNEHGYECIRLFHGKNGSHHRVHRLVAEAFIKNPQGKRTVNHKNGKRSDNRLENLEWCTHGENHKHAYDKLGRKSAREEAVIQCDVNGNFICEYSGSREASRKTGISYSNIRRAANGRYRTAGGFRWSQKEGKK